MSDETTDLGPRPAAPTSALAGLRERREKVIATLFTDLAVPRYDPPIYVRFRPVTQPESEAARKRAEKSKDPEADVRANASVLATCCLGIFDEGGEIDPADPLKFDPTLGDMLGMDAEFAKNPVNVVRQLYFTDADIMATAVKLADWSGFSLDSVEERAGN